ncbi:MAG: hypothetical protein U0M12_01800 [Acutalibacteraceae bacterium]|nr:hypothetical protein [Acutalibacteraceae bacterium]
MDNNGDNIKEILDEVHNSEEISKCRNKEELIYEGEYSLKKSEAYEGLKNAGIVKTTGKRSVGYTFILLVAIICFSIAYVIQRNINDIILAVVSFAVLIAVWVVPKVSLNNLAKTNANGNVISFKVYNSSLQIFCNENSWYIPLNNSNRMKKCENIIMIKRIKDDRLFVIPIRAIEEDKRDIVLETLKKGTLSFEK